MTLSPSLDIYGVSPRSHDHRTPLTTPSPLHAPADATSPSAISRLWAEVYRHRPLVPWQSTSSPAQGDSSTDAVPTWRTMPAVVRSAPTDPATARQRHSRLPP